MYELKTEQSLDEKLRILSDAAKYDVACTSSGANRRGKEGYLGNALPSGVCHTFASDGRCVSLLKILMTNHCEYDCKYCKNRKSNDVERATFTPREICELTIEFYKRNYIEGLFLSSGVLHTPEYTMDKICETLRLLRTEYCFNGYIHVKAIPGAPRELLYSAGLLADRISINMELPTQESLQSLAPNKNMRTILTPMNQISGTIAQSRLATGKSARMERAGINKYLVNSIFGETIGQIEGEQGQADAAWMEKKNLLAVKDDFLLTPAVSKDAKLGRTFASAGQSTQMIIGATNETDLELIRTTEHLYRSFDLKRVFYSGYIPINDDDNLPAIGTPVPLLREHRLYQADWLMRYYGFLSEELLTRERPFFDPRIDPKCDWAIHHLDQFPVEVNRASCDMLLRVPGLGPTSVKRIMAARRYGHITFEMLRKMGVVLKRAQYFLTCDGRMYAHTPIDEQFILDKLTAIEYKKNHQIQESFDGYQQMNLFRDFQMQA